MFIYVRNLFFAKEGMAIINPKNMEMIIDISEIYIVTPIPLRRNFKLVNPLTLFGESIYQAHSWSVPHEVNSKGNNKISFFTN